MKLPKINIPQIEGILSLFLAILLVSGMLFLLPVCFVCCSTIAIPIVATISEKIPAGERISDRAPGRDFSQPNPERFFQ